VNVYVTILSSWKTEDHGGWRDRSVSPCWRTGSYPEPPRAVRGRSRRKTEGIRGARKRRVGLQEVKTS